MKYLFCLILVFSTLLNSYSQNQEVDEIISKHIEALGSSTTLDLAHYVIETGTVTLLQSGTSQLIPFAFTSVTDRNGRYKNTLTSNDLSTTFIQGYDGNEAWIKENGKIRILQGEEKEENLIVPFISWLYNHQRIFKYMSKSKMGDNRRISLYIKDKFDNTHSLKIDNSNFMIVRYFRDNTNMTFHTNYSDFKTYDGIKFPSKYKIMAYQKEMIEGKEYSKRVYDMNFTVRSVNVYPASNNYDFSIPKK